MIQSMYEKLEDSSDYTILDSRSVNWSIFEFTNGFIRHFISEEEILKPYLLSTLYYSTPEYEDEILLINGIMDPFELIPGSELKIPTIDDLKQFILSNT